MSNVTFHPPLLPQNKVKFQISEIHLIDNVEAVRTGSRFPIGVIIPVNLLEGFKASEDLLYNLTARVRISLGYTPEADFTQTTSPKSIDVSFAEIPPPSVILESSKMHSEPAPRPDLSRPGENIKGIHWIW